MDLFSEQIKFNPFPKGEEDALVIWKKEILAVASRASLDPRSLVVVGGGSVPSHGALQAALAAAVICSGAEIWSQVVESGKVTAPDAELLALWMGVIRASLVDGVKTLYVFTSSLASARRAVDPSIHSGQAYSLVVCSRLADCGPVCIFLGSPSTHALGPPQVRSRPREGFFQGGRGTPPDFH